MTRQGAVSPRPTLSVFQLSYLVVALRFRGLILG